MSASSTQPGVNTRLDPGCTPSPSSLTRGQGKQGGLVLFTLSFSLYLSPLVPPGVAEWGGGMWVVAVLVAEGLRSKERMETDKIWKG